MQSSEHGAPPIAGGGPVGVPGWPCKHGGGGGGSRKAGSGSKPSRHLRQPSFCPKQEVQRSPDKHPVSPRKQPSPQRQQEGCNVVLLGANKQDPVGSIAGKRICAQPPARLAARAERSNANERTPAKHVAPLGRNILFFAGSRSITTVFADLGSRR